FRPDTAHKKMKILKFGGKSLANGEGLQRTIAIIKKKVEDHEKIAVVVSARGNATDELEAILTKASRKEAYQEDFETLKSYQSEPLKSVDLTAEFSALENIFQGVTLLGDYSDKIKAEVLASGEIISSKVITALLKAEGINANAVNATQLIKTEGDYLNAQPVEKASRENVLAYFKNCNGTTVNIVTGFIGSNSKNETTL